MTLMLATVSGPEEAETALAAGADIIDLADPRHPPLGALEPATVERAIGAVAGRCTVSAAAGNGAPELAALREQSKRGVDLLRVGLHPGRDAAVAVRDLAARTGEVRLIAVLFADRDADLSVIAPLAAAGFAGAMLDTAEKSAGRLLDHAGPRRLEDFVARCRAGGLMAGLAGGLEAADVPRLLALRPDFLGFRRALCRDHDRRAGLDGQAVAAIRRLIGIPGGKAQSAGGDGDLDRVLVRDLVLPVSIGAYRHEREKPQRVRFAVTAEVATDVAARARAGDDVGEVFSYDVIVDAIRALVENRHVNLVETLAEDIAARVLDSPQVRRVTVRVEKLDVGPAVVGVEIVRRARD